jgi:RHS repeat-associated protein
MRRTGGRWTGTVVRWPAGCLACCAAAIVACLTVAPGVALARGSFSGGGSGAAPLGSSLVVPGGLDEGQQAKAAEQARLASPEAVRARKESQTSFEGLDAAHAASLAREAFPETIGRRAGALPALPAGQRVVGYPTDNAAQLDLGGGKHGVADSMEPIAVETSPGHHEPLDLSLSEAGGVFQPARSGVGLRIPKRLADGGQLSGSGVSLTPVDGHGSGLGGSKGVMDGATVLYANTQADSDTVTKPLPAGFEEDTLLRSVNSPNQLSYRVGLPPGASLVAARDNSSGAEIVDAGSALAVVATPSAHDAEGTVVPVSMSVAGDTLILNVDERPGQYRYPILVDPTINETGGSEHKIRFGSTWGFYTTNAAIFKGFEYEYAFGKFGVKDEVSKSVTAGERAFFYYPTQGESRIYAITAATSFAGFAGSKMENVLGIENVHSATVEASKSWIETYASEEPVCALAGCATGTVTSSNNKSEVFYSQSARETNEFAGGQASMTSATVSILQEAGPSASFIPIENWVRPSFASVSFNATDPGLGVYTAGLTAPKTPGWGPGWGVGFECQGVQCNECYASSCGASPLKTNLVGLPDGEDVVDGKVTDEVGLAATAATTVKIDNTAPYAVMISGLPPYNEIGYGNYKVKVSATDGAGSVASSGVASMTLAIDGKEVGSPHGSCPLGPCTATGEWTINGGEYASGKHAITMTATDAAGNKASGEASLTFHAAEQQGVGPGSIEPASGAFTLSSTDVAVAAPGSAGLSVQRSLQSRRLAVGIEGPFGRQWQGLSFGGDQSLSILPTGSVVFTGSGGQQSLFTKEGAKFVAPTGDTNLTLSEESASKFKLTDQAGNTTTFTVPNGGTGALLTPASREAAGLTGVTKYSFQTVGGITEPTQALAPAPAGVSCTTLVRGCRALTFNYATTTTATGEAPSEWGDYTGRITRVYLTAYNPTAKEMQAPAVAQYSYDKQGRLRAEWDPRISPPLKTTYGYDAEGHVTAVSPPGQQPWLLHYGTIEGDASAGRLLSLTRPAAATALGEGTAPANTELPKLANASPVQGTEDTVSSGTWTHNPLSYGYQWEDCNATGAECQPIAGAVNPGYTPRYGDEGMTLRAIVTATNSGGTVSVETATSAVVPTNVFAPTYSLSFGSLGSENGKFKNPTYVAVGEFEGQTRLYVSDTGNNRVEEFTTSGGYAGSLTGFKEPTGVAARKSGNQGYVWVADSGNKAVDWYIGNTRYRTATLPGTGALGGIGSSQTGGEVETYVPNRGENRVETCSTGLGISCGKGFGGLGTENGKFKEPAAAAVIEEVPYIADTGNNRVQEDEWVYLGKFGEAGSGPGQFKEPKGIAADALKQLWVVDTGNNRVENFATTPTLGQYITQFGTAGSGPGQFKEPKGIAVDAAGNLYVVDSGNNRVEKWLAGKKPASPPLPAATPPNPGTSAVWTIEYKVPVSGTGAPQQLTSGEVAKWGQTDLPVDATAIFPPDEPMGWPAKDYKRATVSYRDNHDRTVNTAAPSGAIATTEYNASNDVVRTLSLDNRAAALKEGTKSAEVSKLLDTQSTYNSEGTELQSTLGPQHTVKLASGATVEARDHQQYSYDEGAPTEGGPYRLATKVTDGAQYSGKEEDVRTTATSYSGQENLGWKLRKPTSITTDPSGLKLTHTILYDATTGNVVETKSPAGTKGGSESNAPPVYSSSLGSLGSGEGQLHSPRGLALDAKGELLVADEENSRVDVFNETGGAEKAIGSLGSGNGQVKEPRGVAVDLKGNIWVADTANFRLEEFNEKKEFVRVAGWGVSSTGGSEFQICTTSCKAGLVGTGAGQFANAKGIAVDSHNNVWVSDTGNHRIEEFNEKGEFVKTFGFGVNSAGTETFEICTSNCKAGKPGSGNGQFKEPRGLSIAPNGAVWVTDMLNNRVQVFKESGGWERIVGKGGTGPGEFKEPKGIFVDTHGKVWVSDSENNRVEQFSEAGKYEFQFGTPGAEPGQMKEPWGVLTDTHGKLFISDGANNRVEKWTLSTGNAEAHDTQTIYYTTAANATYPGCGEHAEWANLPCQTQPATQPETSGIPNLPVTTTTYNIWDEPLVSTETVGSTVRTKTATYDAAGRLEKSAISSTVGTALPTVTDGYNKESGALEKQSTTTEGKTKTVTSVYNTVGELTSYTDADENIATYNYDIDGRVEKAGDGKGAQTYSYDPTTGFRTKLVDSAAGTFTGAYDPEGNMLTEGYPNGMNASYTYNQTGKPTSLEYVKTTHCTEKCTWFSDSVVPSIHGQSLSQTSTLSSQSYTYDGAGRLTQVQSTPAGKGCTTRIYAYDEDTNRLNLTLREPGTGGVCATTGGTVENHSYDTADRLLDPGAAYSTFGNITSLPAVDAGGSELTSAYYVDNQLQNETQNGQTIGYNLDPQGRTREIVSTGKKVSAVTNHYAGSGSAPAWTVNTSGEWTRDISGIGGFAAVQNNGETPVLQLTNLHGDIVATAYLSETATALASTADTSEFGIPTTSLPPKYSWLGANEIPTELPSGVLDMGARSYVPQLGRFLQPDPISGGSANAYSYTFGDPVNASDPSGAYTVGGPSQALIDGTAQMASEAAAEQAAINAAARAEAERKAEEAAAALATAGPQYEEEGEEWGEWEEEEGEYEYASYHHGTKPESEEGHVEAAVLYQPLQEAPSSSEATPGTKASQDTTAGSSPVPLCDKASATSERPCASDVRINRNRGYSGCITGCGEGRGGHYRRGGIWSGTVGHTAPPNGGQRQYWKEVIQLGKEAKEVWVCTQEIMKTGQCHG